MEEYNLKKNQRKTNFSHFKEKKEKQGRQEKGKGTNNKNVGDSKLVQVYRDTVEFFNRNRNSHEVGESILYDINKVIAQKLQEEIKEAKGEEIKVEVVNEDTFDMAERYMRGGYKTLVLNLASDYKPGGGVNKGKMAQEECLFRRSNAHLTHPPEWYPLHANQVIYSPKVTVIKDSNYEIIKPFEVGMITVAALRKPKLNKGCYFDEDRDLMTRKIEAIFKIAIIHGYDALVLGALGCGVFDNPPAEVAKIFQFMLNQYKNHFKVVGFAVLCKKSKDDDNLREFKKLSF